MRQIRRRCEIAREEIALMYARRTCVQRSLRSEASRSFSRYSSHTWHKITLFPFRKRETCPRPNLPLCLASCPPGPRKPAAVTIPARFPYTLSISAISFSLSRFFLQSCLSFLSPFALHSATHTSFPLARIPLGGCPLATRKIFLFHRPFARVFSASIPSKSCTAYSFVDICSHC